jgi:glycosyltransferase involved in cell wall biosynthesis
MARILISANTFWYTYNFRLSTILRLQGMGHEVCVAAFSDDKYKNKIQKLGCSTFIIGVDARSISIKKELFSIYKFVKVYKDIKPEIILSFTTKNNIYGSLASYILRIPVITNVSGLGRIFSSDSNLALRFLIKIILKSALKCSEHVFFQNKDDLVTLGFDKKNISTKNSVLNGSGVDLKRFSFQGPASIKDESRFFFVGRFLKNKGILDFINVAYDLVNDKRLRFFLVGYPVDGEVGIAEINKWVEDGVIEYLGDSDNVENLLAEADCLILPTIYGEGTPKSLIEGLALGKYIITYNTVGARDTVIDGINGVAVPQSNISALKQAVLDYSYFSHDKRLKASLESRSLAESLYDQEHNIDSYVYEINNILNV